MLNYFKDWFPIIKKTCIEEMLLCLEVEYNNRDIYPKQNEVFKPFTLCKYSDLRIVFISSDVECLKDFDIKYVCSQGMLYLNHPLTTANTKLEYQFVEEIVSNISSNNVGMIYIFLGCYKNYKYLVNNAYNHVFDIESKEQFFQLITHINSILYNMNGYGIILNNLKNNEYGYNSI